MNDEEWLDRVEELYAKAAEPGRLCVDSCDGLYHQCASGILMVELAMQYDTLIRLARRGLAAEKLFNVLDCYRDIFEQEGYADALKALAEYEAAEEGA